MSLARMSSKGQITVPKEIREHLHIRRGDQVEFLIRPSGEVMLKPKALDISDLYGMAKSDKTVTLAEMKAAIRKRAVERAQNK